MSSKQKALYIHGKRWYYRLVNKDENKTRALMQDYNLNELSKKIIICFTPIKIPGWKWRPTDPNFKHYRLFAVFDSYLDILPYFNNFKEEDRCFYEIILGQFYQKPHFDIDIDKDTPNKEQLGRNLIQNLIKTIGDTIGQSKDCLNPLKDLSLEEDVLIYDSNKYNEEGFSENKISYHVIINNYYHENNLEAKAFYEHIVSKMPDNCGKEFIDPKVYSNIQQFRIVGCQKVGSGRIKLFNEKFNYFDQKIKHIYNDCKNNDDLIEQDNSSNNDDIKLLQIFYESLITCNNTSNYIPSFYKKKEYQNFGGNIDVTPILLERSITLMKEKFASFNPPIECNFPVISIEDNQIILKRKNPSYCPMCNKIHDAQNPYIFINNSKAYWNCRRQTPSLLLGYVDYYNYTDDLNSYKIPTDVDDDFEYDNEPIFKIGSKIIPKESNLKISSEESNLKISSEKSTKVIIKKKVETDDKKNDVEKIMNDITKYKNEKYKQRERDNDISTYKNFTGLLNFDSQITNNDSIDNDINDIFDTPTNERKKIVIKKHNNILQFN